MIDAQTHRHTWAFQLLGTQLGRLKEELREKKERQRRGRARQEKKRLDGYKHKLARLLSSFWKRALTPAVLLVGVIVFVLWSCCARVVMWLCCVVFSCLVAVLSCLVVVLSCSSSLVLCCLGMCCVVLSCLL